LIKTGSALIPDVLVPRIPEAIIVVQSAKAEAAQLMAQNVRAGTMRASNRSKRHTMAHRGAATILQHVNKTKKNLK
jgi:hypothetical protein